MICVVVVDRAWQQRTVDLTTPYNILSYCRDYTPSLEEEFNAYKQQVVSGQDLGFGSLMTRLEAALSVGAYEDLAVVKKCSNSSIKRKESKIRRAKRREEGSEPSWQTREQDSAAPCDVSLSESVCDDAL